MGFFGNWWRAVMHPNIRCFAEDAVRLPGSLRGRKACEQNGFPLGNVTTKRDTQIAVLSRSHHSV